MSFLISLKSISSLRLDSTDGKDMFITRRVIAIRRRSHMWSAGHYRSVPHYLSVFGITSCNSLEKDFLFRSEKLNLNANRVQVKGKQIRTLLTNHKHKRALTLSTEFTFKWYKIFLKLLKSFLLLFFLFNFFRNN